jgi:alcohol dehydrogenase (cytochrome c)
MHRWPPVQAFVVIGILQFILVAPDIPALAQQPALFSEDQVAQGRLDYSQHCASCHGTQLQNGGAPTLTGPWFVERWNGKTLGDFYDYVHQTMPLGEAASLAPATYVDIVAFILAQNGFPTGAKPLIKAERDVVLDFPRTSGGGVAVRPPAAKVVIGALDGPVTQPSTQGPSQAELDAADSATDTWLMYNKGYRNERYSSLDQINAENAAKMHPVCIFQLGEIGTFSTGPVVYDGLLYVTSHLSTYAVDATTCRKVWSNTHAPQGPEMNETNKGVAIAGGRVFRGSQDGFLYALDAKTGAVLWKRQVADWSQGEGVGAAPIVWNDIVYVGKAGGDWGIHGSMMAFHVEDGSLAWSFDLLPAAGEPGGDTWPNDAARERGGGAVWVSFALDRDAGLLFVPVGNPGPDFNASVRAGANLFTNSTVALDARTGKLKWAYQLRQNDDHDWDATVVSLFDSDGRKLLATAGKEGVLHVVDRETGQLVFKLPVTTMLNHDAPLTAEGVRVCPVAGVQWNGPAHSPASDRLYVNAIDWCTLFKLGPVPAWRAMVPYTGLANGFGTNDPVSQWSGWINAIDPKTGQFVWRVHRPTPMYAAITATAGNVLFTGDLNGDFLVLNAENGQELYSFNTGGPISGGVVTYARSGKQYVAVASGNSGGSIPLRGSPTVVVFGE